VEASPLNQKTQPLRSIQPEPSVADRETVEHMNSLLANEFSLFTKTLNYHWNVTGPHFLAIHKFLDDHYHSLLEVMDETAERIRALGGFPIGTIKEFHREMSL